MAQEGPAGKLSFLDSFTKLFRKEEETAPAPEAVPAKRFANLEADFEAAIRALNEKVEVRLAESASTGPAAVRRDKGEDRIKQKLQRMEATHRAIREDIEKMHGRLETGIGGPDLDALAKFLEELDGSVKADKDSHSILPRARYAISGQLQARAGELAIARLADLLQRQKLGWPDPTQGGPGVTAEELERSRRRRLAEIKEAFLGAGLKRTARAHARIGRRGDPTIPQRGSALWEESVLEAIAAGIRGELVQEFVQILTRDAERAARPDRGIPRNASSPRSGERSRVACTSIDQANQAMASAFRVLDEVFPQIAWEHLRSKLPRARGEWSS